MKTVFRLLMMCLIAISIGYAKEDRLQATIADINESGCVQFEFIAIVESDIFESSDTTGGKALFAADGRYFIHVGEDQYLYDLTYLYSYVPENEQVVIEKETQTGSSSITFITKLDELYLSKKLSGENKYQLDKRTTEETDYPDRLIITLHDSRNRIDSIVFYDINDEKNIIEIRLQETVDPCLDSLFEDRFPKDVERVKLF